MVSTDCVRTKYAAITTGVDTASINASYNMMMSSQAELGLCCTLSRFRFSGLRDSVLFVYRTRCVQRRPSEKQET